MFQSEQIDFATIVTLLPDTNSELPDAARLVVSINPSFYTSNLFTVRDFPTDKMDSDYSGIFNVEEPGW